MKKPGFENMFSPWKHVWPGEVVGFVPRGKRGSERFDLRLGEWEDTFFACKSYPWDL